MGGGGLKIMENTKYWKVSWNKKLYDYGRAVEKFKKGEKKFIFQSKGRANMKQLPKIGDIAYVSCDKRLIMKCEIMCDFMTGTKNQDDDCNKGKVRTHAENETYLKMKICKVYDDVISLPPGMRTWLPLKVAVA